MCSLWPLPSFCIAYFWPKTQKSAQRYYLQALCNTETMPPFDGVRYCIDRLYPLFSAMASIFSGRPCSRCIAYQQRARNPCPRLDRDFWPLPLTNCRKDAIIILLKYPGRFKEQAKSTVFQSAIRIAANGTFLFSALPGQTLNCSLIGHNAHGRLSSVCVFYSANTAACRGNPKIKEVRYKCSTGIGRTIAALQGGGPIFPTGARFYLF